MTSPIESAIRSLVTRGLLKLADFNRNRLPPLARPHPFLTGIHEPMAAELTLDGLAVQGTIPPELDGRYLRIGPNPRVPTVAAAHHWFIGDASLPCVTPLTRICVPKSLFRAWMRDARLTASPTSA